MPTKWRAFLCNTTNFQLFEKSFEKTYKNQRFKSHPLEGYFLVHIDNWMTVRKWYDFAIIWARQRCGEIPGQELFRVKRQKEAFDMWLMELPCQRNKTHTDEKIIKNQPQKLQ